MHSNFFILGLIGTALAAPRPQKIDFDAIEAASDPVIVTPALDVSSQVATVAPIAAQVSAAAAAISTAPAIIAKRESTSPNSACHLSSFDPEDCYNATTVHHRRRSAIDFIKRNFLLARDGTCAPEPSGSGPVTDPDTPEAFAGNRDLWNLSLSAVTPYGYSKSFSNLSAATSASNYIGLYTLTGYDTLGCQSRCDQASNCVAFNIYAERDPILSPNTRNCSNPPSTTNFKCTLWGVPITNDTATEYGQPRASFQVLISASNGYNKALPPSTITGFTGPLDFGGAINAPWDANGHDTYLGYKYYPFSQLQGYTPATCAAACTAQTAYNRANPASDGSYRTCAFFNSFVLSKNGVAQGLYCSLYNQTWDPSYSTNYGQYRGSDRYTISDSYGYSATCVIPIEPGTYFNLIDSNGNYFDQQYASAGFYYESTQPTYHYRIDSNGHLVSDSTDVFCAGDGLGTSFVQKDQCGFGSYEQPICRLDENASLLCTYGDTGSPLEFVESYGFVGSYAAGEYPDGQPVVSVKAVPIGC